MCVYVCVMTIDFLHTTPTANMSPNSSLNVQCKTVWTFVMMSRKTAVCLWVFVSVCACPCTLSADISGDTEKMYQFVVANTQTYSTYTEPHKHTVLSFFWRKKMKWKQSHTMSSWTGGYMCISHIRTLLICVHLCALSTLIVHGCFSVTLNQ